MDDIEAIEKMIKKGDIAPVYAWQQTHYLSAIARTQLLILKELRELNIKH